MPRGNRILSDERFVSGFKGDAFDFNAANRVGPIAHDHLDAMRARRAHAIGHRVHVGVDARADILQVDDERVDIAQHLGGRLAGVAVQRIERDALPRAGFELGVRRLDHVVLHVRPKSVLRTEERRDLHAAIGEQQIDNVLQAMVDRGRVADETDAFAAQRPRFDEPSGAESDRHDGIIVLAMQIAVIAVPYDAGHRSVGVGLGPARLLDAGLANQLREAGHDVREITVELPDETAAHELARVAAIQRELGHAVRAAVDRAELPIVLAGNCSTAVGTLAAAPPATAVVWFDAHGDYNTADTTTTGMVDGLALSMVTGRALSNLTASVSGFVRVDESRVVLVGARDLDPPEEKALAASRVTRLDAEEAAGRVAEALRQMQPPAKHVYVH